MPRGLRHKIHIILNVLCHIILKFCTSSKPKQLTLDGYVFRLFRNFRLPWIVHRLLYMWCNFNETIVIKYVCQRRLLESEQG